MALDRRPFARCRGLDQVGFLNFFPPTHPPLPPSRPAGRKGGASCGRVFKGGKFEPDFTLASKWQQLVSKPISRFKANVPSRVYFPPSKTRPNVAVSSLSAPAGVERVGVRGGIQRKKNKTAVSSQVDNSSPVSHHTQEIPQKNEHLTHTGRWLEVKNIQRNAVSPPASSTSLSLRSSP
jgi:hypothetical protein